jgi:YcaO-like protein with predicted kinase domain
VVERDATTLWRLLPAEARAQTRIDLATVADPACRLALDKYERAGVAVCAWEITSDIGIPAFLCRIFDQSDNPVRRLGYTECMGCHPVREIALLRALTEAAQSRLTYIAGSRDDCYPIAYVQQRDPETIRRNQAELAAAPSRRFSDGPGWQADSFNEDIARELGLLRAAGIDRVVVVDLTRPEFGVPVVRVVIPGLEALAEHGNCLPGARARARMEQRA